MLRRHVYQIRELADRCGRDEGPVGTTQEKKPPEQPLINTADQCHRKPVGSKQLNVQRQSPVPASPSCHRLMGGLSTHPLDLRNGIKPRHDSRNLEGVCEAGMGVGVKNKLDDSTKSLKADRKADGCLLMPLLSVSYLSEITSEL